MAGELYHHIFLPGPTSTQNFTNPRRGGSAPRIPPRDDRQAHSAHLRERLDRAWQDAGEKQAVAGGGVVAGAPESEQVEQDLRI